MCQFGSDFWDSALGNIPPREEPVQLSIATAIPCTAFQCAVKDLQNLLPERRHVDHVDRIGWIVIYTLSTANAKLVLLFGIGLPVLGPGTMILLA